MINEFIFGKTTEDHEGDMLSLVTGRTKGSYVGEMCTVIGRYAPYECKFEDGARWALYENQLLHTDGCRVLKGYIKSLFNDGTHEDKFHKIKDMDTGEVFDGYAPAAKSISVRVSSLKSAIANGIRCKGHRFEMVEDDV